MKQDLPPIITWNDAWSVGVDAIDDEHKKLVDILQRLFGALITVQAKSHIKGLVDELMDYADYHFKNEEAIMEKYDYPHLEEHKAQHIALGNSVAGTKDLILEKGGTEEIGDEVYQFLKSWLINHILDADMQYKDFLDGRS
jgi:hemerythrin-like metal-binding protein